MKHSPVLHCNAYEKNLDQSTDPKISQSADALFPRFDAFKRAVYRCFKNAARKQSIPLSIERRIWPEPQYDDPSGVITSPHTDLTYNHLKDQEHDADISIMLVPTLQDIDPALAHLIYGRSSQIRQVFIISTVELPSRDSHSDLYRGINAVTRSSLPFDGSNIHRATEFLAELQKVVPCNAELAGLFTYADISRFRDPRIQDHVGKRLISVLLEKQHFGEKN